MFDQHAAATVAGAPRSGAAAAAASTRIGVEGSRGGIAQRSIEGRVGNVEARWLISRTASSKASSRPRLKN